MLTIDEHDKRGPGWIDDKTIGKYFALLQNKFERNYYFEPNFYTKLVFLQSPKNVGSISKRVCNPYN